MIRAIDAALAVIDETQTEDSKVDMKKIFDGFPASVRTIPRTWTSPSGIDSRSIAGSTRASSRCIAGLRTRFAGQWRHPPYNPPVA
jgi:hypothetical protein